MLYVRLDLHQVDYRETLIHFYPMLADLLRRQPADHMAIRALQQMGVTARDGALLLLDELTDAQKDELLCTFINLYSSQIQQKLQDAIGHLGWGECVTCGPIYAQITGERKLRVSMQQLKLHYGKLLQKPEVHTHLPDIVSMIPFAGAMASMFEGTLVKNQRLKNAVLSAANRIILKSGVQMGTFDLDFMPDSDAPLMGSKPKKLPEETAEMLLGAGVRLLTRLVGQAV